MDSPFFVPKRGNMAELPSEDIRNCLQLLTTLEADLQLLGRADLIKLVRAAQVRLFRVLFQLENF